MDDPPELLQFATFRVADLNFGVELKWVQELIRHQNMTDVPLASPSVSGLINLRGQIVVAIDARKTFGLPEREADEFPMNVVIRMDGACTSLLVDCIGDVVSVPASKRASVPDNLSVQHKKLIRCIYEIPDSLLLIPNLEQVLQLTEA